MRSARRPASAERTSRAALAAPGVLAALAACFTLPCAHALDDVPGEFSAFTKAQPAAPRSGPVTPEQWEALRREASSFGPPHLRAAERELLAAARAARWTDVLALLKAGRVNVNARDVRGGSVLALAARDGQDSVVRELLARGADRDQASHEGFTPLGAAAFFGQRRTLRLLLRAGADARVPGATGQPPLHLAAMAGQLAILDELLAHGVDPASLNRQRETALDVAAERGQQEAMGRLLDAGVDPTQAGR